MSSYKKPADNNPNTTSLLLGVFFDTTWRMFTPVLGLTLLGWLLDKMLDSRPIGILVGLGFGVLGSVFLTYRLYKNVTQQVQKERK